MDIANILDGKVVDILYASKKFDVVLVIPHFSLLEGNKS
jgi:hypothetical protein